MQLCAVDRVKYSARHGGGTGGRPGSFEEMKVNQSHKVRATKQHQAGAKTKAVKAGKPYRGANFVANKEPSAKKNAARSAASRKATKK